MKVRIKDKKRQMFNAGIIDGKYWYIQQGEIKDLPKHLNRDLENALNGGILEVVKVKKAKIVKEKKKRKKK